MTCIRLGLTLLLMPTFLGIFIAAGHGAGFVGNFLLAYPPEAAPGGIPWGPLLAMTLFIGVPLSISIFAEDPAFRQRMFLLGLLFLLLIWVWLLVSSFPYVLVSGLPFLTVCGLLAYVHLRVRDGALSPRQAVVGVAILGFLNFPTLIFFARYQVFSTSKGREVWVAIFLLSALLVFIFGGWKSKPWARFVGLSLFGTCFVLQAGSLVIPGWGQAHLIRGALLGRLPGISVSGAATLFLVLNSLRRASSEPSYIGEAPSEAKSANVELGRLGGDMGANQPLFPITVRWLEDSETETFQDFRDLSSNLEEFDTHDPEQGAGVTDRLGRAVILRITLVEGVVEFRLEDVAK